MFPCCPPIPFWGVNLGVRPSGWTDRVQTTNFCFCRCFGPDGAGVGAGGWVWRGRIPYEHVWKIANIDFFWLKPQRDYKDLLRLPSLQLYYKADLCECFWWFHVWQPVFCFFLQHATADWCKQKVRLVSTLCVLRTD